ncbi:MAG: exosome complex exonuclease Rrp41 [Candidatus Altiarchaeota archaeon]|nr:exosome complex exonuclease Rrp41 [Candidatus Altiarchaeota archaeon]
MAEERPKYLIKAGKRLDGRKPGDARPMKIETGVIENAEGSAMVEFGKTKVVAAVYGPRDIHPKHMMRSNRTLVRARYDMLPFSVEDRKRPGPGRREREISKVLSETLNTAVFVEKFPRTAIDVFISVIQADASTRVAGLNAASVAMADAGLPMRDLVVSTSFGKIHDEKGKGHMVVDVFKPEDNWGMADIAYAKLPNLDKYVLLQMDGNVTKDEFFKGLEMADKSLDDIYKAQVAALKKKYMEGSK